MVGCNLETICAAPHHGLTTNQKINKGITDFLDITIIRFARACSNLRDYNYRNIALTANILRQGCRYFKLRKAFSKFYRRHSALVEKYSVSLKKKHLQQGISEPEFYGVLVYRFREIVGKSNFSEQLRKLINRSKKNGYSLDIMRQIAKKVREKSRECHNHKKGKRKVQGVPQSGVPQSQKGKRKVQGVPQLQTAAKPQPFPDPKWKRKPTNLNKHKPNKRTKSTKIY